MGDEDERGLIEYLLEIGVSVEEITEARSQDRLVTAGFQHLTRPPGTMTLVELADLAGVSIATAAMVLRVLGLPSRSPEARVHVEADIELVRVSAAAVDVLGEELAASVLHVVGASFDRIADAAVGRYYATTQRDIDESDMSLREQAEGIRAAAEALCLGIGAVAPRLLAAHLWQTSMRYWAARQDVSGYESAHLAVGFVDLVGFTPLSRRLSNAELSTLVSRFESVAFESVAAAGGRVVKLIGDEVMFVAVDAAAAVKGALTLIDAFEHDESAITPRGGVAVGELLARDGDYYGPTVNLAARIAAIAPGYELLITNPARDQLLAAEVDGAAPSWTVEPAGEPVLKGFEDPVAVFRVVRSRAEVDAASDAAVT